MLDIARQKLAIPVSVSQNIWHKLLMYSSYKDTFKIEIQVSRIIQYLFSPEKKYTFEKNFSCF